MRGSLATGLLVAALSFQASAGERKDTVYGASQPDPQTTSDRAVWGAIAYSPSTGRDGIFWGAPTREEAGQTALKHCRNASRQGQGATDCAVAVVIYNDWDDRQIGRSASADKRAPRCGAVAISYGHRFVAGRGRSLKEARDRALAACSIRGGNCRLQQDLCT